MGSYSRLLSIVALMFAASSLWGATFAQSGSPDITLARDVKGRIIQTLIDKLNHQYVFPEVAQKITQDLIARQQEGEYERVTSARIFAGLLTAQLRDVSHDKHLGVEYDPERIAEAAAAPGRTAAEEQEERRRFAESINFCFDKVERMPGNVGYLELRCFDDPALASETAVAAMRFLANTYGLVIDLRRNRGGDPGMIQLLATYLFGSELVHLNDIYTRTSNTTQQFWTLPYVPGRRLTDKDIWILTSQRTFSAAEEFAYDLKSLKRATIVGETTGGGANPENDEALSDHFFASIPFGRAINPITKTNWEGAGVTPDVPVRADLALKVAYLAALKKAEIKESNPHLRTEIQTAIADLQKELGKD